MARGTRRVCFKIVHAAPSPRQRIGDFREGRAMSWDDQTEFEIMDHLQSSTCGAIAWLPLQLRKNHAKSVFPKRVSRQKDPFTCAIQDQSMRIVRGRGQGLPTQ